MTVNDLTLGKPSTALLRFSIPLFIGNLFQQIYNIVDTIVVGQLIGSTAMASVGTCGVITNLVNSAGLGLASDCCILISQYVGAKKNDKVKSSINTSVFMFVALGLLGTILGLLFIKPMLRVLNTPQDMFGYCVTYLKTVFLGILFVMLYNILNQISTALGDSKTPMYSLLVASVLNVVLDIFFTICLHMSIMGVALATVIGQGCAAILCYLTIKKHINALPLENKSISVFEICLCKKMAELGVPSLIQNVISSSGVLAIQSLLNSFGSITVAAYTAANKIDGIAMTPMVSLGTAMAMYTGQNVGSKKYDRVKDGFKFCNGIAFIICVILGVFIFFQTDFLMKLFVSDSASPLLFNIGKEYLHVAVFSYFIMAVMFITTGLLRGAGNVKIVFACAMLDLGMRCLFAYVMVHYIGRYGLWLSYPFGWICSCLLCFPVYLRGKWKNSKVIESDK